jgi:hypothetical protein
MSKFVLMLIGTLAIGMFALPGVVSTFSGSHDYIAPENVECMTCHPEVYQELVNSVDDHTHAGISVSGDEWTLECVECHTVSGIGDNPSLGHAAQKVDCDYCHDNTSFSGRNYFKWAHNFDNQTGLYYKYDMECNACHRPDEYNIAGMFLDDVYVNIVNPNAAHFGFYNSSLDSELLLGASEACIGCHTHVDFNMTEPLGTSNMTYNPLTGEFGMK